MGPPYEPARLKSDHSHCTCVGRPVPSLPGAARGVVEPRDPSWKDAPRGGPVTSRGTRNAESAAPAPRSNHRGSSCIEGWSSPSCLRFLPPRSAPLHRFLATFAAGMLLAASTVVAQPARPSSPASTSWSGLAPGPHAVGYRLTYLEDASRTLLPDTTAPSTRDRMPGVAMRRVVPVRIWYPASAGASAPFATIADIVADRPRGTVPPVAAPLRERTMSVHRYAGRRYARAGGATLADRDTAGLVAPALATRTTARLGAPAGPGRHPLVVFAGGTAHTTDENAALWEHLASHGYVVAALPTVAALADAEGAYLPDDALGLETLARDMEMVLARLRSRADVDAARVAFAGFSFGGAASIVAAARGRDVRAVVAFDGSLIARQYQPIIRSSPLFDVRRVRVPLLEFHRADTSTVDLGLVEAAEGSERTSIELSGLDHVDFNSYVLLYGPLLRRRGASPARDSALLVKEATYRAMVETTVRFLDEALGGAPGDSTGTALALRAGGPVWSRVPASTIRARRWPAR